MSILKTIADRRSIRKYTGKHVNKDKLLNIAKAAMQAPTSRDTRHLRIIIVDDENIVNELTEGLPYSKMLLTAKHAMVVASDLSIAHGGDETDYWIQDCSAAAQNILLAAHDLGIGTCWTAAHPREERVEHVKKILNMPPNVKPLCVIAAGISAGEEKPRDKFDESCVHWNKWNN